MAFSVGDALLKIGVDKRDFDRDMKGLSGAINKHKKAIGIAMVGMGVAAVGAVAASIKAFADMGDEIQKMALRTEFSTEALSELKHIANISGAELNTIEKAVKKMSKTIVDADEGMATYIRSFDRIGLSAEDLMALKPEEQFEKITQAIADLESPTLRAATAQDIFGRAGTQLLPMLDLGAEGMAELRQEAHDLGIVFDQEAANRAAELKDSLTRLEGAITGVKFTLAQELMPSVEAAIPLLEDWAKTLGPIIENTLNWYAAEDRQIAMHDAWKNMATEKVKFLGGLNNEYEESVDLLESMLKNQGLWTSQQEALIRKLREEIKARKDQEKALEDLAETSEKTTEEMLDDIKDLTREARDSAKDRARAEIEAIDDRMRIERDAHQERMDALREEYNATTKAIDAQLDFALKGYRTQLEAIDEQIRAIEDAGKGRRDTERKAEIEAQIASEDSAEHRADLEIDLDELILKSSNEKWKEERKLAYKARIAEEKDADERKRLEQRLADFLIEIQASRNRQQLEDNRKALYTQMDMAREQARNAKDQARDAYDTNLKLQEQAFDNFTTQLNSEREALDAALEEKLERYDADLEAFETLLAQEEEDMVAFVAAYNGLIGQLKDKTVTVTTVERAVSAGAAAPTVSPYSPQLTEQLAAMWPGFQHGGIAMRPMLARVAEKVPEAVIPLDRLEGMIGGGRAVNIYVELDGRIIGQAIGQPLVDEIRLRTGVKI